MNLAVIRAVELTPSLVVRTDVPAVRPSLARVGAEFPTVALAWHEQDAAAGSAFIVDEGSWRADEGLAGTERAFDATGDASRSIVRVRGGCSSLAETAIQVLTRLQRYVGRTNAASSCAAFEATLDAHRALHDLHKPLVRADYDHACDAWQWMLRLDPKASVAAQLAALFHDVERLETEADARIEHRAIAYQRFKDAHAARGATIAVQTIGPRFDRSTVARVESLIAAHERPSDDPELALLNDADALSFFSLNSNGFLAYFGAEHTAKKVRWTLARMTARARARLSTLRLHAEIAALVRSSVDDVIASAQP